jgi:predicted Rdx family selenoprotein
MRYFVILKAAFRALRRNKMRTALTMLGIIIGVGAVIAMVGIGNGAKAQVQARIAALGQNVIMIFSGSVNRGGVFTGFGGAGTLTVEDASRWERSSRRGGRQPGGPQRRSKSWRATIIGAPRSWARAWITSPFANGTSPTA